jgi:hypothetical protein
MAEVGGWVGGGGANVCIAHAFVHALFLTSSGLPHIFDEPKTCCGRFAAFLLIPWSIDGCLPMILLFLSLGSCSFKLPLLGFEALTDTPMGGEMRTAFRAAKVMVKKETNEIQSTTHRDGGGGIPL